MSPHHPQVGRRASRTLTHVLSRFEILEHRLVLSAPPLGPELVLPGDTTPALSVGQQTSPSLAEGPNGISLAVWQDTRSGSHPAVYVGTGLGTMTDIYAARVRADGSVIDVTPIPIANNSYNQVTPKAAWNGTNWLVTWNTELDTDRYESDIHAVRLSPDGVVLDQQPMVIGTHLPDPHGSDDIDPTGPLVIASNGSDWFVQWRRHNPNLAGGIGMEWFATKVTADGTVPDAQGVNLLTGDQYYNDFGIAFSPSNGGQFLHAYQLYSGDTYVRRFDANMSPLSAANLLPAATDGEDLSIAGSPHGWLLTWEGFFGAWPQVHALRIAPGGTPIDTAHIEVTEPTYGVDFTVDGVWNGVNWTIAFSNYAGGGSLDHDIFTRRLDPSGPASSALKQMQHIVAAPDHQIRPQLITSENGGYKLLYEDGQSLTVGVAVAVVDPTDVLLGQADVSLAAPSQGSSELASDGSNFLMVFASSTGYGTRLLGQRLTPQGVALDQEPLVLADVDQKAGSSYEVVYLNGKYVAIFNADTGPQGKQIYARGVETDGTVGPQVALMPNADFTGFSLGDASVNGDRLILVGNAREGANHRSSRFARIFDSDLAPVSDRISITWGFALNGDTEAVHEGWVTAWANRPTHDFSRNAIWYAVIGLDGTIIRPATDITGLYPSNDTPTVVSNGAEAATEAMIIYPHPRDLFARRVAAADGTLLSAPITLIAEPEVQSTPAATFDGTNYVLTWTDQRNYPYPAQSRDDIFAARVSIDGTVLDPGGFPVADSFRPEMHGDVAVAGGQVMFAYRTFRHEAPWGSYRLAARGMTAQAGAALETLGQGFDFERDQAVSFVFNKPIMGADSSDLVLENLTTGQTIDSSLFTVETVAAGTTGWTYRWKYTGGILADGRYKATLPAGSVTDFAGRPTTTDLVTNFHVLAGDANRDGRVDLADFNILAANFGQSGRTFSQGDFNYDGQVNLEDFNILAGRFGTVVSVPSAGATPLDVRGARSSDRDGLDELLA